MRIATLILIAACLLAQVARVGPPSAYQPPFVTGLADPAVTQANIAMTICVSGYTAGVRDVTEADKKFVTARDHATTPSEVDHLISLELGGSNNRDKNLWAEHYSAPYGARVKDVVEKMLNMHVCGKRQPTITLKAAQDCIVADWIACGIKYGAKGLK